MNGELIITKHGNGTLYRVPEGKCYIEGDNIDESLDSNTFGPVPILSLIHISEPTRPY